MDRRAARESGETGEFCAGGLGGKEAGAGDWEIGAWGQGEVYCGG